MVKESQFKDWRLRLVLVGEDEAPWHQGWTVYRYALAVARAGGHKMEVFDFWGSKVAHDKGEHPTPEEAFAAVLSDFTSAHYSLDEFAREFGMESMPVSEILRAYQAVQATKGKLERLGLSYEEAALLMAELEG